MGSPQCNCWFACSVRKLVEMGTRIIYNFKIAELNFLMLVTKNFFDC